VDFFCEPAKIEFGSRWLPTSSPGKSEIDSIAGEDHEPSVFFGPRLSGSTTKAGIAIQRQNPRNWEGPDKIYGRKSPAETSALLRQLPGLPNENSFPNRFDCRNRESLVDKTQRSP